MERVPSGFLCVRIYQELVVSEMRVSNISERLIELYQFDDTEINFLN